MRFISAHQHFDTGDADVDRRGLRSRFPTIVGPDKVLADNVIAPYCRGNALGNQRVGLDQCPLDAGFSRKQVSAKTPRTRRPKRQTGLSPAVDGGTEVDEAQSTLRISFALAWAPAITISKCKGDECQCTRCPDFIGLSFVGNRDSLVSNPSLAKKHVVAPHHDFRRQRFGR